jgi:hypothetical protein
MVRAIDELLGGRVVKDAETVPEVGPISRKIALLVTSWLARVEALTF